MSFDNLKEEVFKLRAYDTLSELDRYKLIFTKYRKLIFVGSAIQVFLPLTSIDAVMYFGPEIMANSGITLEGIDDQSKTGIILAIPFYVMYLIGPIISIFIIDSFGRRYIMLRAIPLIFYSQLLIALGMGMSVFSDEPEHRQAGQIILIVAILLFILFFGSSYPPVASVVNSEIYPIHVAGTAIGFATSFNWLAGFIFNCVFLLWLDSGMGKVGIFLLVAFISILAFLFVYFYLPETAGRRVTENIKNIMGEEYEET